MKIPNESCPCCGSPNGYHLGMCTYDLNTGRGLHPPPGAGAPKRASSRPRQVMLTYTECSDIIQLIDRRIAEVAASTAESGDRLAGLLSARPKLERAILRAKRSGGDAA